VHAPGEGIFHKAGVIKMTAQRQSVAQLVLIGQQIAILVDDRDLILAQLGNTVATVDASHDLPLAQDCGRQYIFSNTRALGLRSSPDKDGRRG